VLSSQKGTALYCLTVRTLQAAQNQAGSVHTRQAEENQAGSVHTRQVERDFTRCNTSLPPYLQFAVYYRCQHKSEENFLTR